MSTIFACNLCSSMSLLVIYVYALQLLIAGCYYHNHGCYLSRNSTFTHANQRDREREDYFKSRQIKFVFKWECHFDEAVKKIPRLKELIGQFSPPFYSTHPSTVTQEQILTAVKNDTFYGLILCDLHLPDHLKKIWDQYPPLCGKSDVSFQDIGKYMQNYYIQNDIPFKTQNMLMQAFQGENMLLPNELLKWYLQKGLIVTRIKEVVESVPGYPFLEFANAVTSMRRRADLNPDEAIKASIAKLIG